MTIEQMRDMHAEYDAWKLVLQHVREAVPDEQQQTLIYAACAFWSDIKAIYAKEHLTTRQLSGHLDMTFDQYRRVLGSQRKE